MEESKVVDEAVTPRPYSVCKVLTKKKLHHHDEDVVIRQNERDRLYIIELENALKEHGLKLPEFDRELKPHSPSSDVVKHHEVENNLIADGSIASLSKVVPKLYDLAHHFEIHVQYKNLTFWNEMPEKSIPSVGLSLKNMFTGGGKKLRVDIIKNLTGRIHPRKMTLVVGPPGCGECFFFVVQCNVYCDYIISQGKLLF